MRKLTEALIRNGPWANLKVEYSNSLVLRNQTFHRPVLPVVEICCNYVVLRSEMF